MEGSSEMTPLMTCSPSRRPASTRDVEMGHNRFLSVETVERSLENRKISELAKDVILGNYIAGLGIALCGGFMTFVGSFIVFPFPALFACPTIDEDEGEDLDFRCFFRFLLGGLWP